MGSRLLFGCPWLCWCGLLQMGGRGVYIPHAVQKLDSTARLQVVSRVIHQQGLLYRSMEFGKRACLLGSPLRVNLSDCFYFLFLP